MGFFLNGYTRSDIELFNDREKKLLRARAVYIHNRTDINFERGLGGMIKDGFLVTVVCVAVLPRNLLKKKKQCIHIYG